jgi:serine phosphatase RsbU (regulator of sigma subunit)
MRGVRAITCFVLVLISLSSTAMDQRAVDSVLAIIESANHDSTRASLYLGLVDEVYHADKELGESYNQKAFDLATQQLKRSDLSQEEHEIFQYVLGHSNTNLGFFSNRKGDIGKAIFYYDEALRIQAKIGDKVGEANTLSNLGFVYNGQGDTLTGLEYYEKALAIQLEIDDKGGQANSYNNIGALTFQLNDWEKALDCFQKAKVIYEEAGYDKGTSHAMNNLGQVYLKKGDLNEGLKYLNEALKIRKRIGNKRGIASTLINLSNAYDTLGDYAKALDAAQESMQIARELQYPASIRNAARQLSYVYKNNGRYKEGWQSYELYIEMRDSLRNDETQKAAERQQLKYEFDKEQALKEAEHENELALQKAKDEKKEAVREEESQRQNIIIGFGAAVLLIVMVFALFLYRRFQITRDQRNIISSQKQAVEAQKQQLETTHTQLASKNKEVIDSINYAQRIQEAFLRNEKYENASLPDHFVLYRPKDIVSGDFYWVLEKQGYMYLAVADCTGHGVPGAFLTMLGTSILNEMNAPEKLLTPAEILDQLRDRIVKELGYGATEKEESNDGSWLKDGMDISLIRYHLQNGELMWAGANNPLCVLRAEASSYQLVEYAPNKQPVGYHPDSEPFTNHNVDVKSGDSFYLFSDGFQDQFGGEKGKKYKSKRFREKLLSIVDQSTEKQLTLLETEFDEWKGQLEQLDDVCVIGVKV